MLESSRNEALVHAEFIGLYWADRAAGRNPGLEHYLSLFPGREEVIRSAFEEVSAETPGTDDAMRSGASATPTSLGPYRLLEILGRGGQATVWLAEDERVERRVALKVLHRETALTPSLVGRFRREAALTARLDHPAICPMVDLGTDGVPWIAMRYVPGRTLAELLHEHRDALGSASAGVVDLRAARDGDSPTDAGGPSPPAGEARSASDRLRAVLELVEDVARAVHVAHEHGIVHRDLKPNNVMIQPDGRPVVLDFGVALDESEDVPTLTGTGELVGTPAYLAPEQIAPRGRKIDRRVDVHALGVILFECLTGRRPFEGASREALFHAILNDEAPSVRRLSPELPADVDVIAATALRKNPDHRYTDALALADDLRRLREHRPILARPVGPLTRVVRWARRSPSLATALAAILLLLVTGLGVTWALLGESRTALRREQRARTERDTAYDEVLRQKQGLFRLRARSDLLDLVRSARTELWPVAATDRGELESRIARIDAWLERARTVIAGLDEPDPETGAPGHRRQLEVLRERALPLDEAGRESDRRSHPLHPELARLRTLRAVEDRGRRIRDGSLALRLPAADSLEIPPDGPEHLMLTSTLLKVGRTILGREAEGLVRARILEEGIAGSDDAIGRFWIRATLVWALLRNGQDPTEARRSLDELAARVPDIYRKDQQEVIARLDLEIGRRDGENWSRLIEELDRAIARVEAEIARGRTWDFASNDERWWHEQLTSFVEELERFAGDRGPINHDSAETGWSIERRRAELQRMLRELDDEERTRSWQDCIARVASSASYGELDFGRQPGLVPLGPDRSSGYEEFWMPASGARPARDPKDGTLVMSGDTGLVFVLLPAATYVRGAQSVEPAAPGFDPHATKEEGNPRAVSVSAFFVSKYEMTQGQYVRLAIENPSTYRPGLMTPGSDVPNTPRNPVESVTWTRSVEVLGRFGLELPDESQWEYAARGGSSAPWWVGSDPRRLQDAANVADETALDGGRPWAGVAAGVALELDDGHVFHAPVGSFRANRFGLHDVLGNVQEWCRGEILIRAPKGFLTYRPSRGGSYMSSPYAARSAARQIAGENTASDTTGLRPVRALR